ncbi:MarR family winged helix-turn-helix transcriptional regulator [Dankookia sp. P2]|uniref:MarR family winged helix-turn-helix transcriptional regulator n=1 Tax=Dankookia sp. P2 TaxID=3423955 RepID=UPI003D66CEE3
MPDLHEPNLLILLNDVARLIRTQADRRARAHGMTRAQWMILVRLRRCGGMTQRELAEILEVEPITVGRLVDRLAARKLVERRADPADRRVWRLHLTPPPTRSWPKSTGSASPSMPKPPPACRPSAGRRWSRRCC